MSAFESNTGMTTDGLQDMIGEYLAADRPEELLPLVKCAERKEQMAAAAWDLVPLLCTFLTEKLENSRRCVVTGAADILLYLAEIGNPKELFLALLEQADTFKDDVKFLMLLLPIQKCLLQLPSKRSHSLAISLETLNAHIESLPLPEERQFEGKERLLLDFDACVQRATVVVPAYCDFVLPFVKEVSWRENGLKHRHKHGRQITELSRCLIKMLAHPMAYLDLAVQVCDEGKEFPKSSSRACAEKIIGLLAHLHPNFVKAVLDIMECNERIEHRERQRKVEDQGEVDELERYDLEQPVPYIGLCVFAYLAFGEKVCPDNIPLTYSHPYLLELCLPLLGNLLGKSETLVMSKGLSLLSSLLILIQPMTVPAVALTNENMTKVITGVIGVMTSAKVKELCQSGVKLLGHLTSVFDREGRGKVIHYIFNTCSHVGVQGYAVTMLKNEIDQSLKENPPSKHFRGAGLEKLVKHVFTLPEGEKTDLLENSEKVMGALNLLRYLVLRDPPQQDVTGIWQLMPHIEQNYCEKLRTGINMSRAHYQLDLKRAKESKSKAGQKGPEMNFTVSGQEVPALDRKQEIQVLEMAVHTFDMMESILGRVGELVLQQRQQTQLPTLG